MAGLWIQYDTALRDFWKIQRLSDLLGIPYTQALGVVSCLWLWAALNQDDGDLSRFTDQEIAKAARWEGEINGFRGCLTQSELLDADGGIHRWDRYGTRVLREARVRKLSWEHRKEQRKEHRKEQRRRHSK